MNIAIIDSGIDVNNPIFNKIKYQGFHVRDEIHIIEGDIQDEVGHGTAVASIIMSEVKNCNYVLYKTINSLEYSYSINSLITVLEHILQYQNQINIIHISSGCTRCTEEERNQLKSVCDKLIKNKVIIVAAYDNEGAVSYPAYFENVIGVDWSLNVSKVSDYIYVKKSPINILGIGTELRVLWTNREYRYVSGSSFSAPYITINVAKALRQVGNNYKDICIVLEKNAKEIIICKQPQKYIKPFKINKAIIFPVNKEIHSILAFTDLLEFQLSGIYDVRVSGTIGKRVDNILTYLRDDNRIVESYEKINWKSDFDTFIIGHTRNLSNLISRKIKSDILDKCLLYKKNVYSFDDYLIDEVMIKKFQEHKLEIFHPKFKYSNLKKNNRNKLFKFATPTVAIIGTSSKQGKFTLQLELIKRFKKAEYNIGHFSTEPSGALFGSDITFPVGFDKTVDFQGEDMINMSNSLMHEIEKKSPDIILVGTQSHTIPNNEGNLGHYPLSTLEILLGTQPDACILCINYDDPVSYINNTILFIESYLKAKVIALCFLPVDRQRIYSIQGNRTVIPTKNEIINRKKNISDELAKKVFKLGNEQELDLLFEEIINFFS